MTNYKIIARLFMATTVLMGGYIVWSNRDGNKKRMTKRQQDIMDAQHAIVEGSCRGIELVMSWFKNDKITKDMVREYASAVDVDDDVKSKVKNL